MSRLVRYAGYDPDENNFVGVLLAPLHQEEFELYQRTTINIARAVELRNSGQVEFRVKGRRNNKLSWREVGQQLAEEEGRSVPYGPAAIYRAVHYSVRP